MLEVKEDAVIMVIILGYPMRYLVTWATVRLGFYASLTYDICLHIRCLCYKHSEVQK
jgi:hypothetical protein